MKESFSGQTRLPAKRQQDRLSAGMFVLLVKEEANMAELMKSIKITLPENYWRGIIKFGIPKGEDLSSSLDIIFRAFLPERYQSIISDYRKGLHQDTFASFNWPESREVFLSASFVAKLNKRLNVDAPGLTADQLLSYLLIKLFEEGLAKITEKQ